MKRTTPVRALAAAAMAVVLTGCIKMDMQLDVSENDTVDGEIILALSRDASAMAEAMGEDPSSVFGDLGADLPEGAQAEEYEDGDFVGQRYTFEGVDLSEFSAEESGFGITHEGEEIVVDGNLDMTGMDPEAMAGELEGLGGDAGELGDMDQLMESLDMSVSITFPGEVTDHNGELDGTTVTWTPVPGEANEISARSADSGGGGGDGIPVWIWILIIVVVLGLAALLFFLSRNRNQAPPADEAPAAGYAGTVPPPPAGPYTPGSGADAPTVTTEAPADAPTAVQPPASTPQPPVQPTRELPQPPAEGGAPGQEPPAAPR
jgi:hypothetical protein